MRLPQESALVVLVPEVEPMVKSYRDKYDPSATRGMPAHITILYPFKPPQEIAVGTLSMLQNSFARFPAFAFSLAQVRRFPDVLYLAPVPDAPFRELTRIVVKQFPETPPYGGAFGDNVIPHLTVARIADPAQLQAIEAEIEHVIHRRLPVRGATSEVTLMDTVHGGWQIRARFRLGTD